MEQLTALQFIKTRFISDMKTALDAKLRYYVCPLICQGIEIMGAFYDKDIFDTRGLSRKRFKKGLSRLFINSRYASHADDLFEEFRCSMVHQLRPGGKVILTSSDYDGARCRDHLLSTLDGKYYIVVEQLYEDFVKAFHVLENDVKTGNQDIDQAKLTSIFFQYGIHPSILDPKSTLANDGMYSRTPSLSGR